MLHDSIPFQRLKGSNSGSHPLAVDVVALLRQLREQYPDSRYLFPNERGEHISQGAIAKMMERAGEVAKLPMAVLKGLAHGRSFHNKLAPASPINCLQGQR